MSEPFGPGRTIAIRAGITPTLIGYAHGGLKIPTLTFSRVQGVSGVRPAPPSTITGAFALEASGCASLSLDGHFVDEGDTTKVEVGLADGSIVVAESPYLTRHASGTRFEFARWKWSTRVAPVAWMAVLRGVAEPRCANLVVHGPGEQWSRTSMRLQGNLCWYLTQHGAFGERSCLAIVDADGSDIEDVAFDFAALEFLSGTPLQLESLVGVDERNAPVAAYGAALGYRFRRDAACHPPVPGDREAAWTAVAFPRVARALRDKHPNPVSLGICGYVDSTLGHIDGQYLFGQVALEAVADLLVQEKRPVVKDQLAWKNWVRSIRPVLEQHGVDAAAVDVLAAKIRGASRPTTSRLAAQMFARLRLDVPVEALDEIEGRNSVAHTLSMNGHDDYEVERDVRRIRIVRGMVAAAILRHAGYEGALADWHLDWDGWPKLAPWFPVSDDAQEEARRLYEAR